VAISREKHEYLNDCLIGFYAGSAHHGGEAAGEQCRSVKERHGDTTAHRSSRIVSEAERIISDENPQEMAKALGSLLHETWSLKKSLNPPTAGSYADEIYRAATGAGAYGGKVTGSGGNAFLFFLTAPEHKQKIREALNGLTEVAFRLENEGSKIIYRSDVADRAEEHHRAPQKRRFLAIGQKESPLRELRKDGLA
jgi:D-glycero-alpha-D-manno-heptose-7-phosphate kinase